MSAIIRQKDVLLEHIARDVKQSLQSDMSTVVDMVSSHHAPAQALCEHLDRVFMHGLRDSVCGYWPFVVYFTRSEAVQYLSSLSNVHLDIGRGRAWLCTALNEQALESYVRMVVDNQDVVKGYYLQESFLRDLERLVVLQTLVSGLDFISFELAVDCDYLDFAPSQPSPKLGISQGNELTPDIEPSFLSNMAVGSTGSFDNHSDTQGSTQTPPITFIQRMYADKEDEEEIVTRKQKKARKKKKKTPKLATTAAAADTQHPNHQPQEQEQEPVHQPQEQEQEPVHQEQEQEPVHQEQEQEQEPVHQKQEQEPVHQPQEQEQEPVHQEQEQEPVHQEQEQEQEPVHQEQEQEQEPVHQEQEQELYPEKEEPSKEPVTCTSTEIIKTEPVITMGTGTEETDGGTGTADGGTDARMIISDADKRASDIVIDETTRLVLSLDVLSEDNEQPLRLVQLATPSGVGLQRIAYCLITDRGVYILRKDGIEGNYSKELDIQYPQMDHIVIGLGWQSLGLVYACTERCVLLTGREAVSRGIVETVCSAAGVCPGFLRSIPLNRDDDVRTEAIEKELIKLGSHTSMEVVLYSLVNWEQVSGEPPAFVAKAARRSRPGVAGSLFVKSANVLGLPVWKQGYFELKSGSLYQYSSEGDSTAKSVYTIRNCGGCTRVSGESKPFTISIVFGEGTSLLLAAPSEDQLTKWLQALCEAVIGQETSPGHLRTCLNCALLLTQNMLHILLEDWTTDSVQLVTSCRVTDLNGLCVDSTLPLYCTVEYDHGSDQGVWLLCFNSAYELLKFERDVCRTWEQEFQIQLTPGQVSDPALQGKAHKAVDLMTNSRYRSDSVTRGRSEFTYSATF
ncbi:pleckstrin homology domain-containing family M member 2-like isoform X2 [Halichondria panicea]|uniref:pleckstrin homology domain-containing family M member 2-like isoform X2 n=1 Tax=Halichondria panicea TaxID=6063 RepID=UPI00312B62D8